MTLLLQNLTIRPESVQSLYASYLTGGFIVNRRYQRKLVWTIEEKRSFVDSLKSGYPVPLFLFAELQKDSGTVYEIIDGMQRLNAIFSFLEGEFDVDGQYFDLETIPETKQQLHLGRLRQHVNKMPPEGCRRVVTYQFPLSVARNKTDDEIDEIFRRINSHGKHLSRQELRQAGSTGHFAQLVRKTAARIRGDVSASERLDLSKMRAISITNREPHGLDVSKLFWVENKILTPDQVRESRDEELIADIFGYILLAPKPPSNAEVLNEYYGDTRSAEDRERFDAIERAVQRFSETLLITRYMRVHDEIRDLLARKTKPFNQLMFKNAGSRVPRYFQVVFLALYDLLITESMKVHSPRALADLLDGIGNKGIKISEGGKWGAAERETTIDSAKGIIRKAFRQSKVVDPAIESWVTEFENILTQSATENNLYDWKQGVHTLAPPFSYDSGVIDTIANTLGAMANYGPGATGYVLVGLTDEERTAQRIRQLHKVEPQKFRNFFVFGVDHEAKNGDYKKGVDSYFQRLKQAMGEQPLTPAYRDQILKDMRNFQYFDRHVIMFRVTALDEPCAYKGEYFQRSGPHVDKFTGEDLKHLFKRFYSSGSDDRNAKT